MSFLSSTPSRGSDPAKNRQDPQGEAAVGRSRALALGLLAVAIALWGQRLLTKAQAVDAATRWYAVGIVLMIVAWRGTYKNKSILSLSSPADAFGGDSEDSLAASARWRLSRSSATRLPLVVAAVGLNLFSAMLLHTHNYSSWAGGLGWLASLLLLLVASAGQRQDAPPARDTGVEDVEIRTDFNLPRALEISIGLAILALALALRLYRLGDWMTGVHGDEGEAGMDALGILEGHPVSPFQTGWAAQSNFYYWGIALTMKVFGTGLSGLRMFSALAGSLMIVPFYLLVRQWFGVRAAIIASIFLAISDVTIHFSRQEFTNITTPFFQVTGFFFLFRGLHTRRFIYFVLAGYAHMLTMYFYLGGRLTPILLAAYFVYLFLLLPLTRLPGLARRVRERFPALTRLELARRAVQIEGRRLLHNVAPVTVFLVACICFATPWLAYYADHRDLWNVRAKEKIIFSQADRMIAQHDVTHDPLYLGLRLPSGRDTLPLPIGFEKTPVSVRLARDGFWPRVIWKQLTTTLSILTYRQDGSSFYTFAQEAIAKPVESALIVLGIAWALWRWRDERMALLSIWFWLTILIGGALTIDAPYMSRLIGIVPAMAVFASIPLNKLAAELADALGRGGRFVQGARIGRLLGAAGLGALLAFLAWKNYHDYYVRYLARLPFAEGTGNAYFVKKMNEAVAAEGRPKPMYYELGAPYIFWGYGVNRFLNHDTEGLDIMNASNQLPVLDNRDRDIVFLVWQPDQHYLPLIKAYYPGGIEAPFRYGQEGQGPYQFTSYRVKREQLDAYRVLRATYVTASGSSVQRDERDLGSPAERPEGLVYPVQGRWTGGLVAPKFGVYRFWLESPGAAALILDGTSVVATTGGKAAEREVVLARGAHDLRLSGALPSSEARIRVKWSDGSSPLRAIPPQFFWTGPGRALAGEIRPLGKDPFGERSHGSGETKGAPVIQRRIDGFLGLRDASTVLSGGSPLSGTWTGNLTIADPGLYQFHVSSNGDSTISIDRRLVVDGRGGGNSLRQRTGRVALKSGRHRFELRYIWSGGVGYLEVFWTPPGRQKSILGPGQLSTDGGVWPAPLATGSKIKSGPLARESSVMPADVILAASSHFANARGCALDALGNLYVADTERHRIALFDARGQPVRAWGKEGRGRGEFVTAEDVAVGPDGKISVLDSALARVQVFTPDGRLDRLISDVGCSPAGLTVGLDGAIYVADTCGSGVRKYGPSGDLQTVYRAGSDPATRLEQPVDVAVGRDGSIFVADLRDRIVKIDPSRDTIQKTWPMQIGRAFGASNLALTGTSLYISDPDRGTISVIDVGSGRAGAAAGSGGSQAPLCLPGAAGPR